MWRFTAIQMMLVPSFVAVVTAASSGAPNMATIELYLNNPSLDPYAPRQGVNTAVSLLELERCKR